MTRAKGDKVVVQYRGKEHRGTVLEPNRFAATVELDDGRVAYVVNRDMFDPPEVEDRGLM